MLVDDETNLLGLLTTYLSRLGYGVVACASASDAWERIERAPTEFPLVVLDLNMPGISGQELSTRILRVNPKARLILSSGYPFDISKIAAPDPRQVEFLQKPYSPGVLAKTVQRMLAEQNSTSLSAN